jgi:hypothetical protein
LKTALLSVMIAANETRLSGGHERQASKQTRD